MTTQPSACWRVCRLRHCTRPHRARGLCSTHYTRWRRNGHLALIIGQEPEAAEPCAWCRNAVPINNGRAALYCRDACRNRHKRLKRREKAVGATA